MRFHLDVYVVTIVMIILNRFSIYVSLLFGDYPIWNVIGKLEIHVDIHSFDFFNVELDMLSILTMNASFLNELPIAVTLNNRNEYKELKKKKKVLGNNEEDFLIKWQR